VSKYYKFVSIPLLILVFFLLIVTVQYPFIGLQLTHTERGDWVVSDIDSSGWAGSQPIYIGDTVRLINGNAPELAPTVRTYRILEQADHFEIERGGKEFFFEVPNGLTGTQFKFFILFPSLTVLTTFLACRLLLIKRSGDPRLYGLVCFFVSAGYSYVSAGASSQGYVFARLCNGAALLAIPVFFLISLNSYLQSFRQDCRIPSWLLKCIVAINAHLLGIEVILTFSPEGSSYYSVVPVSQMAAFFLEITLCLGALLFLLFQERSRRNKPQMKYIFLGLLISFSPYILMVALPRLVLGETWMPELYATVFLVFLPAILFYLITSSRLIDIDFYITRFKYYAGLALLIAVATLAVDSLLDPAGDWLADFIIVFHFGILLLYIKEQLDYYFRNRLFTEKSNFQKSLDKFAHDISKVLKVRDLEERLRLEVKQVLNVTFISILEYDMKLHTAQLHRGYPGYPSDLLNPRFVQSLSVGEVNVMDKGALLLIGERANSRYLMWIGEKTNRTGLNLDEKSWLQTLSRYAGIVYENLYLIQGLTKDIESTMTKESQESTPPWLIRFMFQLQEKERSRLGLDLHDSVLQNQLYLYRNLSEVITEAEMSPDLKQELVTIREGLLDVIHEIRITCNELRPSLLREAGLMESLRQLFRSVQLRENFVIEFDLDPHYTELEYEQTLAIYRIIQELLGNAAKHSGASQVKIRLVSEGDNIFLYYKDDGVGLHEVERTGDRLQIGLTGIRERVSCLEGTIDMNSGSDQGVEIIILLPRILTRSMIV
jgi:two-component system, NarL family, sensor histidine kinase ComP